ncbi:MBL fold metallo-hydrolase [Candidatus Berkelbacteria bacterium]|nr:MBL fold metallo-hydrolase [Candidatus Berkelbacteria bacterium]
MNARRVRATRFNLFFLTALIVVGFVVQLLRQPIEASGQLIVRVLDIGQGDAILVTTPERDQILIDAGPGAEAVPVILRFLPAKRLTLVVATHNDADHIGGFPGLFERIQVDEVWLSGAIHTTQTFQAWLRAVQSSGAKVQIVKAGVERLIGTTRLIVLHPFEDFTGRRPDENHDATLVVKLTYGLTSALFTGDLDEKQEAALVARDSASLGATLLKVSHHGSEHGSTDAFLEAVHPKYGAISAGAENRYGHPHAQALERLAEHGIETYRTDLQGTLTFVSDGLSFHASSEK